MPTLWCLQCSKAIYGLEARLCICETCETLQWTFKGSMLCLLSTHYSGLLLFTCTHKIALAKVAYKQSCREANQEGLLPCKKFQMGVVETAWKGSLRESPHCRRNNSAEQAGLICSQDLFCSESDGKTMPLPTQEKDTRLLCVLLSDVGG